jgi:hypothetical protein
MQVFTFNPHLIHLFVTTFLTLFLKVFNFLKKKGYLKENKSDIVAVRYYFHLLSDVVRLLCRGH